MTSVLVTGASGFVGRHVVPALLARGCDVHSIGRRPPEVAGVTHHPGDLLAWDGAAAALAASRPDIVLHLAWTVEHGRFWMAPENLDWVAASLRLARLAAASGVRRLVGVGTCMEYAWSHEPGRARREDDPLAATSLYAEAKIAAFRVLGRFCAETGVEFAWGRVFHPFGPGEPAGKLVPAIARAVRGGGSLVIRSGPLVRDFIAVEDVAEALAALALSPITGPVNIATGRGTTVQDLAQAIQRQLGGGGTLTFDDAPAGSEPPVMTADVSRLREEVGLPAPPPMEERLARLGLDA